MTDPGPEVADPTAADHVGDPATVDDDTLHGDTGHGDTGHGDAAGDPAVGDDGADDGVTADRGDPSGGRARLVVTALVALCVGVLGTWWVVQARTSPPPEFGADAGFARDMQTHHAQAVEMAFLVRDRTADPEVRTVAYDIITSQQQQAGQMYGWLVQWGLPQTGSRPPMAWVGGEHAAAHAAADGTMPGMATPAQLAQLEAATGVEAERIFLRLMIAHHTGGVAMAQAAVAEARTPEVRTLAGAIAAAQTSEIALLQRMLAARS